MNRQAFLIVFYEWFGSMGFVWSKLWWWWLGLGRAVTEVCIVGVDGWLHEVNGDLNWKNGYMNCGICLLFSSFLFYYFIREMNFAASLFVARTGRFRLSSTS